MRKSWNMWPPSWPEHNVTLDIVEFDDYVMPNNRRGRWQPGRQLLPASALSGRLQRRERHPRSRAWAWCITSPWACIPARPPAWTCSTNKRLKKGACAPRRLLFFCIHAAAGRARRRSAQASGPGRPPEPRHAGKVLRADEAGVAGQGKRPGALQHVRHELAAKVFARPHE